MACVGLTSATANTVAIAGVFSCTAPATGTKANLAAFYDTTNSAAIPGTNFVCVTGAAPT